MGVCCGYCRRCYLWPESAFRQAASRDGSISGYNAVHQILACSCDSRSLASVQEGILQSEQGAVPQIVHTRGAFRAQQYALVRVLQIHSGGLATTIVFLYPVLVALIMVFLKVYPTWQVWLSILMTFVGVVILCKPSGSLSLNMTGLLLAGASALSYALYLVVVNRSRRLRTVSNLVLTLYALLTGSLLFIIHNAFSGGGFLSGVHGWFCWANLAGLAIFPTLVSLLTLAIATRVIGATKTSVLGVFEPVTAIAVGTIFFGESLTVNVIVGVAITLVAVTFMVVTAKK